MNGVMDLLVVNDGQLKAINMTGISYLYVIDCHGVTSAPF
jgi:hypothetical protein